MESSGSCDESAPKAIETGAPTVIEVGGEIGVLGVSIEATARGASTGAATDGADGGAGATAGGGGGTNGVGCVFRATLPVGVGLLVTVVAGGSCGTAGGGGTSASDPPISALSLVTDADGSVAIMSSADAGEGGVAVVTVSVLDAGDAFGVAATRGRGCGFGGARTIGPLSVERPPLDCGPEPRRSITPQSTVTAPFGSVRTRPVALAKELPPMTTGPLCAWAVAATATKPRTRRLDDAACCHGRAVCSGERYDDEKRVRRAILDRAFRTCR